MNSDELRASIAPRFRGPVPVRVYLDSSDYSRLSNPRLLTAHPELREIRHFLEQSVDAGKILVRYSSVHIAEILHLGIQYRQAALERARLLKRLSGLRTFRAPLDVTMYEAARLVLRREAPEKADTLLLAEDDSGRWFPDFGPQTVDLASTVREQLQESLKERKLNRHQRRLLAKEAEKRGLLSQRHMRSVGVGDTRTIETLFPLTDRFYQQKFLERLIQGDIGPQEFADELMRGATDPENFVGWYFDSQDKGRVAAMWVRNMSERMFTTVQELRKQLIEIRSRAPGMTEKQSVLLAERAVRDVIGGCRTRLVRALYEVNGRVLNRLGIGGGDWERIAVASSFGELPSLDLLLEIWTEYAKRIASESRGTLKESDGADMLHAMYLPYVDLFRADGAFGELLRPLAVKNELRLVTRLEELLPAIEQLAQGAEPNRVRRHV